MKLYLITSEDRNRITNQLLRQAAAVRDCSVEGIDPAVFDYSNQPRLEPKSLLYRVEISLEAIIVESLLLRADTTTLYHSYHRGLATHTYDYFDAIIHEQIDIPVPTTVYHVTAERDQLKRYVEYLGGFPIVIKALGGSHGIGIMKVDSFSSLLSIVEYMLRHGEKIMLRQYIKTPTSSRLIVINDRVIDSIEYTAQGGDFRSNVGQTPVVQPRKFSDDIEATAIAAVKATAVDFGGVDILIDEQGNHYVTETNFPCNFARAQTTTGTDIAGQMLDYLIAKSEK